MTTLQGKAVKDPIALVGLGATGVAIARALDGNGRMDRIAGVVDADPAKVGCDVATLTGLDIGNLAVLGETAALDLEPGGVAVVTTYPILVVAEDRAGEHVTVPAGTVAAVEHVARAKAQNGEVAVRARFGVLRADDEISPHDVIRIEGDGRALEVQEPSGFDSKATTIAVLVNSIDAIASAPPGLRSMSDLTIGGIAAHGKS